MEYIEAKGTTLEEMRENAQKSMPANQDEMKLIWMKETDLLSSGTSNKAPKSGPSLGLVAWEIHGILLAIAVIIGGWSSMISILMDL
ncbi:hypothetical protein ACQU0X_25720 [Pseudovibrio ascidiaceicola]|uniref:hypothetical protein n=1 Tax=Pseudovibrio ascidiaceicola TaxID=285279 RepID=UPI003D366B77